MQDVFVTAEKDQQESDNGVLTGESQEQEHPVIENEAAEKVVRSDHKEEQGGIEVQGNTPQQDEEQSVVQVVDATKIISVLEEVFAPPATQLPPSSEIRQGAPTTMALPLIITAADLIQAANASGRGAGDDWKEYKHRHKQAVVDSEYLSAYVSQSAVDYRTHIEQLQLEAIEREHLHKQELKEEGEKLATAHAEFTVRERAERAAKLDAIRLQVNALGEALKEKSKESERSHSAHQMALAAAGLRRSLDTSESLKDALAFVSKTCQSDSLIHKALQAIPEDVISLAAPTRVQIYEDFERIRRVCGELSLLPEGRGGFLSVTVAKLANSLKVKDKVGPLATSTSISIDSALARVSQALTEGDLIEAADRLADATRGTAASEAVQMWVSQAKARALMEQTADLLSAHAAVSTAQYV